MMVVEAVTSMVMRWSGAKARAARTMLPGRRCRPSTLAQRDSWRIAAMYTALMRVRQSRCAIRAVVTMDQKVVTMSQARGPRVRCARSCSMHAVQ